MEGVRRITTETGAGQWGSAMSFACNYFGLELLVFMVKVSYDQKPGRKLLMNTYNAKVLASPSNMTEYGRKVLELDPDSPGSLGIAISEAMEVAGQDPYTKYALGSVLNHVSLHQTIIGQEAAVQISQGLLSPSFGKIFKIKRKPGLWLLSLHHVQNLQKENSCTTLAIRQV